MQTTIKVNVRKSMNIKGKCSEYRSFQLNLHDDNVGSYIFQVMIIFDGFHDDEITIAQDVNNIALNCVHVCVVRVCMHVKRNYKRHQLLNTQCQNMISLSLVLS